MLKRGVSMENRIGIEIGNGVYINVLRTDASINTMKKKWTVKLTDAHI